MVFNLKNSVLFFLAVGILVYFYSLFNGFVWDNYPQILENPAVLHFDLGSIFTSSAVFPNQINGFNFYYKPLMYVFFACFYAISGDNPFLYHLFQLGVHLINTTLVWILLRRFTTGKMAFFLSLIFLIHPINFEAVGYIAAFQDTLCFVFGLSAFLLLTDDKRVLKNWAAKTVTVTILFLLALLSKETGILFVIMSFVYLTFFNLKKIKQWSLIFILMTLSYSLLRALATRNHYGILTNSAVMDASFIERLQTTPSIIFYYLKTLFFPWILSIDQQWVVRQLDFDNFYLPLIVIVLAGILLLYPLRFIREEFKKYLFFLIWLLVGLGAHTHILLPLDMTVADRWFYTPFVGVLGVAAILSVNLKYKGKNLEYYLGNQIVISIIILIVCILSVRTFSRSLDWADRLTLYTRDEPFSTDSYSLENKLAATQLMDNKFEAAQPHLQRAVDLNPNYSPALVNLGYIYESKKQYDKAEEYYLKSVETNPGGANYKPLGAIARIELFIKNDPQKAEQISTEAIAKFPEDSYLRLVQAMAVYAQGDQQRALELINQLYKKDSSLTVKNIKNAIEKKAALK